MKLNIENKILIPFVLLFLLSQSILLATSFRNDYNLIIDNQYRNMDASVQQLERSLLYSFKNGIVDIQQREEILLMIESMMDDHIIIEWNSCIILNPSQYNLDITTLETKGTNKGIAHLQNDDYLFSYYYYAPLGWSMIILEDKKALLSFFYESYKYNILASIIFLTLSLQMTVFISANITNPIKKLVRYCATISEGDMKERVWLKRQDEIGQLNDAFNGMLDQLDLSMNELITVKNYNQNILNSIEKGIVTFNKNRQIISSNPYADELNVVYKDYFHDNQQLETVIEALIDARNLNESSLYKQLEFVHKKDGECYYLDCYVSTMTDEEGNIQGYICSFNDVTDRKAFEGHIQRLDRLATAGHLASGVAHEIRNPLTGMRTSLQVLKKRQMKDGNDGGLEIINRTIKEIDRINQLISDLLGYSKPSQHAPTQIRIREGIESVLALLENDFAHKAIDVRVNYEKYATECFVDSNHFHQIILNIIKNAIEAIDSDGSIEIKSRKLDDEKTIELTIKDSGIGMTALDVEKIFDPFFTLKHDGTGLGMSVVYELVRQNDGVIKVNSKKGEGTTIVLQFKVGGK